MNSIVMTKPALPDLENPIPRPHVNVAVNDLNLLTGTFPKPTLMIGREPVLGLLSLRAAHLLDIILALSWDRLGIATEQHEFGPVLGRSLRLQLGEADRHNNDRLDAAFVELLTFQWRLPISLGSQVFVESPILADASKCDRKYIWRFHQTFVDLCQDVPLWATCSIQRSLKLKYPRSHRLQELLSVFVDRDFPIWNVAIVELRKLMGDHRVQISDDKFIDAVIESAAKDIAQVMKWQISVECIANFPLGPTNRVRFTVKRSASGAIPGASI